MRKFLVLLLAIAVTACGKSNQESESMFLNLMRATEFRNPKMVKHFSDDFKTFFTGLAEYNIKNIYEFDSGEIIAEYNAGKLGNYYFGFIVNPWGMDGSMYLYMTEQISRKLSKEELRNEIFSNIESNIGYAIVFY